MLSCDEVLSQLSPHLDGELPADAADAVDDHLGGCARCGATLAELAEAMALVADAPRLELDPALIDRTVAAAAGARDARGPTVSPAPFLVTLAVAAALVLAVLPVLKTPAPSASPTPALASASPAPTATPAPEASREAELRAVAEVLAAQRKAVALAEAARKAQRAQLEELLARTEQARLLAVQLRKARADVGAGKPAHAALTYLSLLHLPEQRPQVVAGLRKALAALGEARVLGRPVVDLDDEALCKVVLQDEAMIEVLHRRRALLLLRNADALERKALARLGRIETKGDALVVHGDPRKLGRMLKRAAPRMRRAFREKAR